MQYARSAARSILVGAVALAVPAFAQAGGDQSAAGGGSLTDPQIVAIVVAANQVDIDSAKLAKSHTKNPNVLSFADTMVRDHESLNNQTKTLAKQLKVKVQPNPTAKTLTDGAKTNDASLKKLKGAEFDRAYVDHEVAFHQQVLDTINNQLIPGASNAQVKELLEKAVPIIQAHLDHAKSLQQQVSSGVGGSGK